jgi:hypothetical protein
MRDPLVVGIQKRYVITSGDCQAGVAGRRPASIGLAESNYFSTVIFKNTGSSVGGTVIDNDDLLAFAGLRKGAIHRSRDGRGAVVDWNYRRDMDHR